MALTDRLALLSRFIGFLEDRLGYQFKVEEEFDKRFRLQKYVFFARFFGLDLGYDFNLYMHGPYSPELAKDYYELSRRRVRPEGADLPRSFKAEEYVRLLLNKDDEWLEAAATILDVWENNKSKPGFDLNKLVHHVSTIKPHIGDDKIKGVIKDLKNSNLLS